MKEFDIDKLERKNIYKTPENFFDGIQANVLQQTIPQKRGRIVSFNWAYAAAAALALIFASTFLVSQGDDQTDKLVQSAQINVTAAQEILPVTTKKEATVAYETYTEDLTSVVRDNQKANAPQTQSVAKAKTIVIEKPKMSVPNPEVQVDQILANITSAELAVLGKNVEQDVYLDLYY